MVREQTHIESQISTPTPADSSPDAITQASLDAWDPRGGFEQAPVFTKEGLVAEQTKRAEEGRPLLGRFVLQQPEGSNQSPADYSRETIRELRSALGKEVNWMMVSAPGDSRAYINILGKGTDRAEDESGYIDFGDGSDGGDTGGGGGDGNSSANPRIYELQNEQANYRLLLSEAGVDSQTAEAKDNATEEHMRRYFNLPPNADSGEITQAWLKMGSDAEEAAVDKLPPGATDEQIAAAKAKASNDAEADLRSSLLPELARKFGLSNDATWLEIESEIADQYRQEAALALGLDRNATREEIVGVANMKRTGHWDGEPQDGARGIQNFGIFDADKNPYYQ
jgi:hypothetical protein